MSLKTRFLLLAACLVLLASAAAWSVFQRTTMGIIEQWGERVAAIQVQYDSGRLLQPLEREIALRQLSDSIVLRRWAEQPDDPALEAEAFAEMESFRHNFGDNSYFVALRKNGGAVLAQPTITLATSRAASVRWPPDVMAMNLLASSCYWSATKHTWRDAAGSRRPNGLWK